MIDSFMMIRLHSQIFNLDQQEQRVDQFRFEMSETEGSDQRFVHSLAAFHML